MSFFASAPALILRDVGLFTLGPKGVSTPGGTKVIEIGPIPPISASEYLLRVNRVGAAPGIKSPVHTHPGSEASMCWPASSARERPTE